jgi:hypothetical protein
VNWEKGMESENPEEEDSRKVPGARSRRRRTVKAPHQSLKRTPPEVVVVTGGSSHSEQPEPINALENVDLGRSGTPDCSDVGGELEFSSFSIINRLQPEPTNAL